MEELTGSKALRIALKSRSVWLGLDKLRVNYTWNQPVHGSLEKVAARGLSRKCTNNPPTLHNVLFMRYTNDLELTQHRGCAEPIWLLEGPY
jgi:hypothetical protein